MKLSTTQKAAINALIRSKVGSNRYGNSLRLALSVSERWVGEGWDGGFEGEGSVAFAVDCAVSMLQDGRPVEELVMDIVEYDFEDGSRNFSDTLDTVGVTGPELYEAAGIEVPAAVAAHFKAEEDAEIARIAAKQTAPVVEQAPEVVSIPAAPEVGSMVAGPAVLYTTTNAKGKYKPGAGTLLAWQSVEAMEAFRAQYNGKGEADKYLLKITVSEYEVGALEGTGNFWANTFLSFETEPYITPEAAAAVIEQGLKFDAEGGNFEVGPVKDGLVKFCNNSLSTKAAPAPIEQMPAADFLTRFREQLGQVAQRGMWKYEIEPKGGKHGGKCFDSMISADSFAHAQQIVKEAAARLRNNKVKLSGNAWLLRLEGIEFALSV